MAVGDSGKELHYYFTESQNDPYNDPYNDPLVIWTNGGPGCSSMLALLQEHGPFYMEDFGNTFYNNPFSWNKLMFYMSNNQRVLDTRLCQILAS